jgi:hypothetical protein
MIVSLGYAATVARLASAQKGEIMPQAPGG